MLKRINKAKSNALASRSPQLFWIGDDRIVRVPGDASSVLVNADRLLCRHRAISNHRASDPGHIFVNYVIDGTAPGPKTSEIALGNDVSLPLIDTILHHDILHLGSQLARAIIERVRSGTAAHEESPR